MSEPFRLTEFDREVLSVLLSHGGWNASARGRLAVLAKRYGVSATGLSRVVAGLARAAREGRLQEATALAMRGRAQDLREAEAKRARSGNPGGNPLLTPGGARALGPDGSLLSDTASAQVSRSDRVLIAIVASLLLLSIALAAQLGVMVWRGVSARSEASAAARSAAAAQEESARAAGSEETTSSTLSTTAPDASTRDNQVDAGTAPLAVEGEAGNEARGAPVPTLGPARLAAVPVSYPKAPTFSASLDAPAFMQAIAEARSAAGALDDMAHDPRAVFAADRKWTALQRAIGWSWPRLETSLRRAHLERTLTVIRPIDETSLVEALLEPFRDAILAPPTGPAEIRAGAWSAGVLGALLAEPGLSPELVQGLAASRLAPAEGQGDAFERFAAGWLDRSLPAIIDQVGRGSAQDDFDRLEAWIEAHQRLRRTDDPRDAWLRAIDRILRRPLRLDLPGTSADVLGRFLTLTDWSSAGPGASILRRYLESWILDATIDTARLWALGSILRQHGASPWFTPEMVVGERATLADRRAALERMLAVLEPTPNESAPTLRAPAELIARREALLIRMQDLGPDGDGPGTQSAQPLARAVGAAAAPTQRVFTQMLEMERLAAIGVLSAMLLDGRAVEASQSLATLESDWGKPHLDGLGPGGRSLAIPAEPSSDGTLGRRLDQARSAEERIDAIRRRRVEVSTDLGPLDAERLVREAYFGEPSAVRSTAQGVIVDSFARGPRVSQELVEQLLPTGGGDAALGRFIERLTGERLPPHISPQFRARAMAAILRHRINMAEHAWHGAEVLAARVAALAAERLEIEGGAAESLREARDPTAPLEALSHLLRARASSRAVLRPVPAPLDELDRRDEARQKLSVGLAQRLVSDLWRVFELEAFLAAADRPSQADAIVAIVLSAVATSSQGSTVLDQALAIERARVAVQTLLLGGAPSSTRVPANAERGDDGADAAEESEQMAPDETERTGDTPVPTAARRRSWDPLLEQRLAALDPAHPQDYLQLAEEVEARARSADDRALARELYGLAGALDPLRLGASAALAQASLAENAVDRARLVRLASALQPGARSLPRIEALSTADWRFTQLLSAYRRGDGQKARELIGYPDVTALVDAFGQSFEGGAAGFRNAIEALRDQSVETPARLLELMFLEQALLSVDESFVADLLRTNGDPLVACDPLRPGPELGVDPARAKWRGGQWTK